MKKLLQNKRGDFLDWFYIIAGVFMAGVTIIVTLLVVNTLIATELFEETTEAEAALETTRSTIVSFDNFMLFVIIGLSIFVIVSSAVVYNHPAYFIAGVFLLVIATVVAAIASNTFWIFTDTAAITATAANFPKIKFLMNHLPIYIAFMGIAASVTMFVAHTRT